MTENQQDGVIKYEPIPCSLCHEYHVAACRGEGYIYITQQTYDAAMSAQRTQGIREGMDLCIKEIFDYACDDCEQKMRVGIPATRCCATEEFLFRVIKAEREKVK